MQNLSTIEARLRQAINVPGRSLPDAVAAATYGAAAEAIAAGMSPQAIAALRDEYAAVAASLQTVSGYGRILTDATVS